MFAEAQASLDFGTKAFLPCFSRVCLAFALQYWQNELCLPKVVVGGSELPLGACAESWGVAVDEKVSDVGIYVGIYGLTLAAETCSIAETVWCVEFSGRSRSSRI